MKDNCLTLSGRWGEGMQAGCILAHAGHSCTKHDLQLCQQTDTETKKAFNLSTHVSPPQTTRQGSGTVSKPEAVRPSAQPHMTAPRTTDTLRIPRTGAGPSPSPEKPALPSPSHSATGCTGQMLRPNLQLGLLVPRLELGKGCGQPGEADTEVGIATKTKFGGNKGEGRATKMLTSLGQGA